jgi:pyrroline-5-carboxylate reductase
MYNQILKYFGEDMQIVLVGAGNMGSAMLKGLSKYDICVVEKSIDRLEEIKKEYPNIDTSTDIPNIDGKVVILAIKPQVLDSIVATGKAKAVISILAGTPIAKIKEQIDSRYYIRAMPNVAAMNLKSVTSVVGDIGFKDKALEIIGSIGKAIWLNSEKELDIATGLAASSPAWLAVVAEALADGAVNLGLPRDKAYEYLGSLFEGVGSVLENKHPALFKDMVCSPGGTTIAGVATLEDRAVRAAFIEAIRECYDRACKL